MRRLIDRLPEQVVYALWLCTVYPCQLLGYAAQSAGYWIRPYDMLADRRRWLWQRRTPCGRQVWAELPVELREELAGWAYETRQNRSEESRD